MAAPGGIAVVASRTRNGCEGSKVRIPPTARTGSSPFKAVGLASSANDD